MEPRARVELATYRLQGGCSTTELTRRTLKSTAKVVPIGGPLGRRYFLRRFLVRTNLGDPSAP